MQDLPQNACRGLIAAALALLSAVILITIGLYGVLADLVTVVTQGIDQPQPYCKLLVGEGLFYETLVLQVLSLIKRLLFSVFRCC